MLLIYLRRAKGKKTPRVIKTAQNFGDCRREGTPYSPNMPIMASGRMSLIILR